MSKRSRRALPCSLLVASALVATRGALAADGFDLQRLQPSERGSSWFVLDSLDLRGSGRPSAGVVVDYQREPLVVRSGGAVTTALVENVLTTHVGGGAIFFDRVRAAANLPVVVYTNGQPGVARGVLFHPPEDGTTLGDARLAVDARLFSMQRAHDAPATIALGARVFLPTGSRASYTGDGTVRFSPHVLAAGTISIFTWAAKGGVLVRDPDMSSFATGTELLYGASAGVRLAGGRATIGPEIFGSTRLTADAFETRSSPLEALLGGHYALPIGVRLGAGVGAGVVSGYGAPQVRALGVVEWTPEVAADADGDGVPDGEDACRAAPGVRSIDPAKNGCPPPPPKVDTDMDGVPDEADACMDVPGRATGDPKTNGCDDRDRDGVFDPADACPDLAGSRSEDPKKSGCPDKDGDGLNDEDDACPDQPGVESSDPASNGCPANPDRDADGVANEKDACPDEAGAPDANPGKNGCPMAYVKSGQLRLRRQPMFRANTAELSPVKDNDEALGAVLALLQSHQEIPKVRVEGHTDNRGDPKRLMKLSEERAAAVARWLVARGVDEDRLSSVGFGMNRPIDENDGEEGRQNNRRVEFHIETADKK